MEVNKIIIQKIIFNQHSEKKHINKNQKEQPKNKIKKEIKEIPKNPYNKHFYSPNNGEHSINKVPIIKKASINSK